MTAAPRIAAPDGLDTVLKLAVMAVGGQGGGVLIGWIESLARAQGYACQTTSVAGVAQRTGATIYYIEMAPATDRTPVFSLAPAGGDVDVLIAAELMEAGRAIMRGFVTPDRTTLIASTHRALAVSEKMVPGDGIADPEAVLAAAEIAADRLIAFDMEALAVRCGSVISATLFGALAGSGALPFDRAAFEDAIRRGGKGVDPSLRAFAAAFEAATAHQAPSPDARPADTPAAPRVQVPPRMETAWQTLCARIDRLPAPAKDKARAGLAKVVSFMDVDYGHSYLDRLDKVAAADSAPFTLTQEAAKHVANAMAYDDVIGVADKKTRAARTARIDAQMAVGENLAHVTEFLHPRAEEVAGLMPRRLGAWFEASPRRMGWLDRRVNRGRRMRSDRLGPFLALYILGGLRRYRRKTLRHAIEMEHVERWLALALDVARRDRDLAVEILRTRRLIKGYSDTHARGLSKFDKVLSALPALDGRDDAADWLRRLRDAALQDEDGAALDGALDTVRSFT